MKKVLNVIFIRHQDVSAGCQYLAGALRGMYSGVFILVLGLVSGAGLVLNGWLLTAVALNSLIHTALGFFAALMIESHYDMNNFTNIVLTPMSFLCGTFFFAGRHTHGP